MLAGLAGVAISAPVAVVAPAGWAVMVDSLQATLAPVAALLATVAAWRFASSGRRWVPGVCSLALGLAVVGIAAWALVADSAATPAGPIGFALLLAVGTLGAGLLRAFATFVDRDALGQLALDGLMVTGAVICVLTPAWQPLVVLPHPDPAVPVMTIAAIGLFASSAAGYLVLFTRRLTPSLWGPYAVLDGVLLGAATWLAWLDTVAAGTATTPSPLDWLFGAAVLLVAWGAVTWDRAPAPNAALDRYARTMVDAYPLIAVGAAVAAIALNLDTPGEFLVDGTAISVVIVALARQWLLVRNERRAHARAIATADELAREIRHRSLVLSSLVHFDAAGSVEDMAHRICELAVEADGVAQAAIVLFEDDGTSTLLAEVGPAAVPGMTLPAEVSVRFRALAAKGAWYESLSERTDPWADALRRVGMEAVSNGPVLFGERLLGRFATAAEDGPPDLQAERVETARQFGLLAGAIMGSALEERARGRAVRRHLSRVIEEEAFTPVFQPIVEIATGRVVGHEALTRFADGVRPDVRFAEAARVGLGLELERATVRAALRAASGLPADAYISINASPALVTDSIAVAALLLEAPGPVVLEITERDAIENYAQLRTSLERLRRHVRIAVDDVGAGYAGLRHILEIQPDILKLDIALVRGVDADPARRALIGSIVAFASSVGCTIVAEGVETDAEAAALTMHGIALGQGYRFGRARPVIGPDDDGQPHGVVDGGPGWIAADIGPAFAG